jgi:hypothetical protein
MKIPFKNKKLKKYHVSYRREFGCDVLAEDRDSALVFFRIKMNPYLEGELWEEYFTITDSKGNEV